MIWKIVWLKLNFDLGKSRSKQNYLLAKQCVTARRKYLFWESESVGLWAVGLLGKAQGGDCKLRAVA